MNKNVALIVEMWKDRIMDKNIVNNMWRNVKWMKSSNKAQHNSSTVDKQIISITQATKLLANLLKVKPTLQHK